jgi:hypothetical protein
MALDTAGELNNKKALSARAGPLFCDSSSLCNGILHCANYSAVVRCRVVRHPRIYELGTRVQLAAHHDVREYNSPPMLEQLENFLIRHGISGNWLGIVIDLVIILLLIRWFEKWKRRREVSSSRLIMKLEEGTSILKKLLEESIPVVAFLNAPDGSSAKVSGFVDSCTNDVGIVVAGKKGSPESGPRLHLAAGREGGMEFFFGDERELPSEIRAGMVEQYGNTVLMVQMQTTGSKLALFFNS